MLKWHDGERSTAAEQHAKVATKTRVITINARRGRGIGGGGEWGGLPTKRLKRGSSNRCRDVRLAWP